MWLQGWGPHRPPEVRLKGRAGPVEAAKIPTPQVFGMPAPTEHHRVEQCLWGQGLGLFHPASDTRVTLLPNLANSPWDIPVVGHTCALLQPPHGHLQVLGPAQVLPEEVIPATDLLWGGKSCACRGRCSAPFQPPRQELPHLQHTEVPRPAHTHTESSSQQQLKSHPPCKGGMSNTEATRSQVFRGISSSVMQQTGDRASSQPC